MGRPHFVHRKVKNGQVKIFHRVFAPSEIHQEYHGELDGLRYTFGLYYTGGKMEDFVCLWGPEQNYHEPDVDKWQPGPEIQAGGLLPWGWWNEVKHLTKEVQCRKIETSWCGNCTMLA